MCIYRIQQTEVNEQDFVNTSNSRRDIDQLREMLDEKDRHINDLTETLTSFHVKPHYSTPINPFSH